MNKQASKPSPPAPSKAELVKRPSAELAAKDAVPEYLRKTQGEPVQGLENVGQQEMVLPRLGLCQSMTPQRKKDDPKFIRGLEEGDFFNTVTETIYGAKTYVVPLFFFKSRILFNPMEEGGGLRCQAPDARVGVGDPGGDCERCPMAQFSKDDKPVCSLFYNYVALVLDEPAKLPTTEDMVVVSFKSTGLKVSRQWNSLMRFRGRFDSFAGVYEFTSAAMKNDVGSWYQPVVKNAGWATREQYEIGKSLYDLAKEMQTAGRLKVELEDDRTEEVSASAEM